MESSTYRVVKEGLSQREGGALVDRTVGSEIELTESAAAYCLANGYVEPIGGRPRLRKKRKREKED